MRDFTSEMRKVADHLESARKILTQGSLDYYFRKLVEHSEALMGFAKYKIGDEAELQHDIPCTDGWVGSEKHLTKGTTGKIDSVDYANGHFIYYFIPHKQWYKDSLSNTYKEKKKNHSYCLEEKWFMD
jgi:hypothetical protein